VAESDKLASQGTTDGDDNDRRRRREKLEDMLHRVEVCLLSVLGFRVFYFFSRWRLIYKVLSLLNYIHLIWSCHTAGSRVGVFSVQNVINEA